MDTPEQALEHSDNDVDASDLEKIKSLMNDHGDIPEHGEDVDEPEGEVQAAPEKKAQEPAPATKTEPQGQPEIVDVEHEGKTYKVPAELKDAFLRQADYTRKTQEVAKDRTAALQERQALQRLTQQAAVLGEHQAALKQIDAQLQQFQNVNWQGLYQSDRQQWLELQQMASNLVNSRQSILAQGQNFQREVHAYEQTRHQEAVAKGLEEVRKAIPDFGPEHQKALVDTATSFGFTPEETETVIDPRQVLVLHELKNLRAKVAEYEAKETAVAKQVRAAPRMVKPQAAEDASTKTERNVALDRLKKSHSDDDAVAALRNLMG